MKNKLLFHAAILMSAAAPAVPSLNDQPPLADSLGRPRTPEYRRLQERIASGWNTWFNGSMTTHVFMPDGFALGFGLVLDETSAFCFDFLKYSENAKRREWIRPGLRSDDGAYTSAEIGFGGAAVRIETAADGDEFVALVTPVGSGRHFVSMKAGIAFGKEGFAGASGGRLLFRSGGKELPAWTTGESSPRPLLAITEPSLCVRLDNGEIGFGAGRVRTLAEIKSLVAARRAEQERRVASHGGGSEAFRAMQTILAWNTIYNAREKRVVTPVSRVWNINWGGWVLFDWDTYFASYMLSFFNRDLAYANAVEITKTITADGFIPNYRSPLHVSTDRSQPPVGGLVVSELYRRYRDKWLLDETYDELLAWNRWWDKNRSYDGYLAWGSFEWKDGRLAASEAYKAKLESGLDNSPMFDGVPMNDEYGILMQADVGLMSLYVMDCRKLAEIAEEMGRADDAEELRARAGRYGAKLETMWNEEKGIYLNRRLDTGLDDDLLTPCNFYPLLAGTCTGEHAQRMMREHYFNPEEFHGKYVMPASARNGRGFADNDYWRGRIWAPLNFLVYLGMRDYGLDEARADLVKRSNDLLMENWRKTGGIYENYNSVTGQGGDVGNSDGFYHWGALLTFMGFLEESASPSGMPEKVFSVRMSVDTSDIRSPEPLWSFGPAKVSLRLAGRDKSLEGYDAAGGNYLNFALKDGTCPVIEATICEKAGRVGIPLGFLANPGGRHDVTVQWNPPRWAICVDGREVDEDFPVPEFPIVWNGEAESKVLSARVCGARFDRTAVGGLFPVMPDAKPITRPVQYWTPDGHDTWTGDVAPGMFDGKLHVFYLFDRRHHGSGVGTGRHQFAHLESDDLVHWVERPFAVPITEWWQTCGTGTPFLKDGSLALAFGWHTSRYGEKASGMPIGGTYAVSSDGVHFALSGEIISDAQNPSIYNRADGLYELVTSYGGSIGIFRSDNLHDWKLFDDKLPFRGDCPSLFEMNGHRYLLQGFTRMAYSPDGSAGSFVDWSNEPDALYDGLSVPMVTSWKDGRRLYIGWLKHLHGWGGWLVFREVVQYPDGRLGLKWVPEIAPPVPTMTFRAEAGRPFALKFPSCSGERAVELTVDPAARTAAWATAGGDVKFGARCDAENVLIGAVRGLDSPYEVKVVQYYDAKSDATLFDAQIAGQRTLICRRKGAFNPPIAP